MATIVEIEKALEQRIKEIIKDKTLLNSEGVETAINVLKSVLPPKDYFTSKSLKSEYPFILIRSHITEDVVGEDENKLNFKVFIGICVEKEDEMDEEKHLKSYEEGHLEIINLYDSIRIGILGKPALYWDNRYVGNVKRMKLETYAVEEKHPYSISMVDIDISGNGEEVEYYG